MTNLSCGNASGMEWGFTSSPLHIFSLLSSIIPCNMVSDRLPSSCDRPSRDARPLFVESKACKSDNTCSESSRHSSIELQFPVDVRAESCASGLTRSGLGSRLFSSPLNAFDGSDDNENPVKSHVDYFECFSQRHLRTYLHR